MKRTICNVKKLLAKKYSVRELADEFGISYTPMRMWLKRNNLFTEYKFSQRKWTDQELRNAVAEAKNMSDVLRKLQLSIRPGNYDTLKKYCIKLNISTAHFTGKAHGKTKPQNKATNDEMFTQKSLCGRNAVKKRIIKDKLIPYTCAKCNNPGSWNLLPLVLVLDHINGKNTDHRLSNLRFLCPNCNSQIPTFCRKTSLLSNHGESARLKPEGG